jgi:hypothetical protein
MQSIIQHESYHAEREGKGQRGRGKGQRGKGRAREGGKRVRGKWYPNKSSHINILNSWFLSPFVLLAHISRERKKREGIGFVAHRGGR